MERMTKGEGMTPEEYIAKLEKENKELNEKYNGLWKIYTADVKERVEENDKLKIHIEAKDKAYMDLLADYNYLKARIKKTESIFKIGRETREIVGGFRYGCNE